MINKFDSLFGCGNFPYFIKYKVGGLSKRSCPATCRLRKLNQNFSDSNRSNLDSQKALELETWQFCFLILDRFVEKIKQVRQNNLLQLEFQIKFFENMNFLESEVVSRWYFCEHGVF